METLKLFDDRLRTDEDVMKYSEVSYDYYDRSGRKEMEIIRNELNKWFSNYPLEHQNEMKNRAKKSFSTSIYELFLHEWFLRLGFKITIHPIIVGTEKTPDFLIAKDGQEFYIEATEAKEWSNKEESELKRKNKILDSINEIKSSSFFLGITEFVLKTDKHPSIKELVKRILDDITTYDPDELIKRYSSGDRVYTKYEDDNIKFKALLMPVASHLRPIDGRIIGGEIGSHYKSDEVKDSLINSFRKKKKKYGHLDKPYIVCINAPGIKGDGEFDVENFFWGDFLYTFSKTDISAGYSSRDLNGIFLDKTGARSTYVTGVMITKFWEYSIPNAQYWLAKHPYRDKEADFDALGLSYSFVDFAKDEEVQKYEGKSISESFGITESWLYS